MPSDCGTLISIVELGVYAYRGGDEEQERLFDELARHEQRMRRELEQVLRGTFPDLDVVVRA